MRKTVYNAIISILIMVILVSVFGVINTQVNLKYETENPKGCISIITGRDLCLWIKSLKIIIIVCLILTSGMISFRYKLIKD
ncbi:hypothetical protein [Epilithonimonas arachidiradicis]|uniref:Uncharacterized protein n=1 Tax=Epilithonimonas arachidiradicis TaxID=1617282 RepID=A0A420D9C4_9FLAO|nr:hypothetical protein [Epilithonimonas arachidiradicis]RKE87511.1 hypothetical protein BXY58_1626 [Epilithonimonas arachidiradicis]GGG55759.1 hypothetical protein GCM10007332_16790 [Epilithonimonas arachidiradicis]